MTYEPFPSPKDRRLYELARSRGHLQLFDSVTLCSIYGWDDRTYRALRGVDSQALAPETKT